ncbi:MAG: site-2 protease family protein, partial [Phycisphaerae bacterium]|nr:site-2 protease family protein [Phycisphaerae bacterium]
VLAYRPGVGWAFGSTEARTVERFGKSALSMSDEELARNRVGETEYSLRALPLGGFVRLLGQEDLGTADAASRPRSYTTIAVWKRMVVISAGVVFNLIGAIALFVVAFMAGVQFEAPIVGTVSSGSPAATAVATNALEAGVGQPGLQPGDTIARIDDSPIWTFGDVQIESAMAKPGTALTLHVKRPGVEPELHFSIEPEYRTSMGMQWMGISPPRTLTLATPRASDADDWRVAFEASGLAAPGVGPGSTLIAVNGESVSSQAALDRACEASDGKPVTLTWRAADGATATSSIQPVAEFQLLFSPASTGQRAAGDERSAHMGLAGLLPLVRVTAVVTRSPNVGVILPGDVLLRVATTAGPSHAKLTELLGQYKGNAVPLEVLRDGERVSLLAQVTSQGTLGVGIEGAWDTPFISGTMKELGPPPGSKEANQPSPAASLDVPPMSRLVAIDGKPAASWRDLRAALVQASTNAIEQAKGTAAVEIAWQPPAADQQPSSGVLQVSHEQAQVIAGLAWRSPVNPAFFDPLMVTLQADGNPWTAVTMGFRQTHKMIVMTYLTIDRIVRGSVGVEQLRGPVGIVHLGTFVADRGAMYLVFFLAVISVNLAVLNFLPLPIVDGGLFLY